ncbi:hypothetical protein [Cupriavidus metallidurans]|uniref:hypothetical protein n=1 Tax=Cupriavidus metallidurans TaxID=119219 RepID=UPI000CE01555|nr:hypothetical protein [Cupriavidus metallidurans]AVA38261.1 hypothetical protein C3Z06_32160 [Cupriavidus metallidurans]
MKLTRVRVVAVVAAAMVAVGAGIYLHNAPKVGGVCMASQGVKATADGTAVMCVEGTWLDPVVEDWHMHGPLKMSALIERLLPKDWKVDWRARENPTIDAEGAWKSGMLMRHEYEGPKDLVFNALTDAASMQLGPLVATCWNDEKRLVVIDYVEVTASFKDCKRYPY